MDQPHINALLAHILLEAQKAENCRERLLGPIHFLKYVYLADLAHAELRGGVTYTDIPWIFHNFGPWDKTLFSCIPPSLEACGAVALSYPSMYENTEVIRWKVNDWELLGSIASSLEPELQGIISKLVKKFSNLTNELLNFVYNTPPMLHAAPGEALHFSHAARIFFPENSINTCLDTKIQITRKREKRIGEWKKRSSEALRQLIDRKRMKRADSKPFAKPVYDELYYESLNLLDSEMETPLHEGEIDVFIDDGVWKAKARHDI